MKKTLRFALVALFSTIALGASAQTVIWEEDWQSSEAGKLVNEVTNANAVYTLSSSSGEPPKYTKIYANETNMELLQPQTSRKESWTASIDLKGNSGNLTLSYTYNKSTIEITSETTGVTISDVSNTGALINVPSGTATLKLTFSNPMSQNARLDNIKLVTGGTAQEYPEVANIAALKELESGSKAVLTFNNAQVIFKHDKDMYIQDATGALDIYDCVLSLSYTAGQVLNGKATVVYKVYNGMPEITSVSNAELTATDGTATPSEPALDAIDNSLLCHLVKATGTVYIENNEETGKTNYFLEDEDNNSVLFYRKWSSLEGTDLSGLKDGDVATVTGIVVLSNNTPAIGVTEIEYEGGGSQETITAANIAAFKALEDGTVAELTLTDAVVTFVNGKDMYVTDATGSIDFYNCNLSYTAGQKLNGKIKVKYTVYKSTPEAIEPSENNLTATDGEATPQEVAVSSVDISKVCDYVKISGKVKVLEETSGDKTFTNYYIADESDNKVMIYRKWKSLDGTDVTTLNDGDEATITGIVLPFNDTVEIAVTAMESTPTGIENINAETTNDAPIFNIAGQRVEKAVKGIYIQNGKKFIVK